MDFIGITFEYTYIIFMIYLTIMADRRYGIAVLAGLAVLFALGWRNRYKWLNCLKAKNAGRVKLESKKRYYFLVGEAVWAVLLVFDFLFLDTIPAFLFWKNPGARSLIAAITVLGALAVYSIVNTNLDLVITGEETSPRLFWRITPISAAAAAVTLIFYDRIAAMGDLFSSGAYLQALFVLELAVNLGIRFFLRKKKSCLQTR